jgi:hypothetical protein
MKLPTIFIGVMMFLTSCNQQEVKSFNALVYINFSSDNTTSFKISSSDTLFRENKLLFTTESSYRVLSKSEREKLNRLVDKLQKSEQPEPSFAIGLNQSVLYIKSDTSNTYYTSRIETRTSNFSELGSWFKHYLKDTSFQTVRTRFWNIEGVHEPPGPPAPIDSTKIMQPLTSALKNKG